MHEAIHVKTAVRKGVSFGLTSGIITTLGLMVGLYAGTHSKLVIFSGIMVIAIADALSDAMGMHLSVESEYRNTTKEIWLATIATFLTKFIVACTFLVPLLIFENGTAIIVSVAWGLLLISGFSYHVGKQGKENPWKVVLEHLVITIVVVAVTYGVGSVAAMIV